MAGPEFTTEELETEEWRPVVGYEGLYTVSNLGRVRWKTGRFVKLSVNAKGYWCVALSNRKLKTTRLAGVVAAAFLGPRPEGHEVNHIDAVKANNRATNLEYLTHTENIRHAWKLGLPIPPKKGMENSRAKLTDDDVRTIRASNATLRELATTYHVSQTLIFRIKQRIAWKHL